MILGRLGLITVVAASLGTAVSAAPVTRVLDSIHQDFASAAGSNGARVEFSDSRNIEVFSHDYADNVYVPSSSYSPHLATIISDSGLSRTGLGSFSGGSGGFISSPVSGFGTDKSGLDLGRHEIAAYLVSEYSHSGVFTESFRSGGDSSSYEGIGESIRDILDPGPSTPSFSFTTGGSSGHDFLSSFHPGSGSFGIPSVVGPCLPDPVTVVPEPRYLALMLMALLLLASGLLRKHLRAGRSGL
jgi:hypothetical protein